MTTEGGLLAGRVAVVTGGGQGIGRGVALRLAREGAAVAIFEVNAETAERTAGELRQAGARALARRVDVSRTADVVSGMRAVAQELGPVELLANIAGIYGDHAPIHDQTLANWQRVLSVNLTGTFICAREAARAMVERRFGRIVNIASGHALRSRPLVAPYAASKAAVIGFTKAFALEVASSGVTVNALMPAVTDTAMPREHGSEQRLQEMGRSNPLGRIGQPEDLAGAIAFLMGPDGGYITGQTIAVNGGVIMLP